MKLKGLLSCLALMAIIGGTHGANDAVGPGQKLEELTPRKVLQKPKAEEITVPAKPAGLPDWYPQSKLRVKFVDGVRARVNAQGLLSSLNGRDAELAGVNALAAESGVRFRKLFSQSEEELREVARRAEALSNRQQQDWGSYVVVEAENAKALQFIGQAITDETIEWAGFEPYWVTGWEPMAGEDPDCGTVAQSCFEPSPDDVPFCDDVDCCTLVGEIAPHCVDEFGIWDQVCADLANLFCDGGDPCATVIEGGGCLEPHPFPGCQDGECCNAVCDVEPFCCEVAWDEGCVVMAQELCQAPDPGGTPDFTSMQAYRTGGFNADFADRTGFGGQGFDLDGLWDLGQFFVDQGLTDRNLTRGKTINVAVIEHSAFPDHEDLVNKVTPEPGQTILHLPQVPNMSGNHGTACLGEIVAEDNGFGVTGIASDAKGWFFPIVSAEEGGRTQAAVMNALLRFREGDVLSFSIGPGGCGTFVSSGLEWSLIRLASDLGITACMSAGNDCCNLDDAGQAGGEDCGGIIVGACWPGAVASPIGVPCLPSQPGYCRLGFSNHCQDCEVDSVVHAAAWGIFVATTGYGDLHGPFDEPRRQYTQAFSGTSSAAPMVAGLVANLQGFAKMFYGIPLMPEQIRSALSLRTQCSVIALAELPGSPDEQVCGGDFDCDEEPRIITGFPDAVVSAGNIIQFGFFDAAPLVNDIIIVRGRHILGNRFSIKGLDGNYFIVQSQFTERDFQPSAPGGGVGGGSGDPLSAPQIADLTYLATGDMTDVVVIGHSDLPNASALTIQTVIKAPEVMALFLVEAYDWDLQRWGFIDITLLTPDMPEDPIAHVASGARRFIRNSDGRILVRLWTLGFTGIGSFGGGSTPESFRTFIDLVNFQVGYDQGGELP